MDRDWLFVAKGETPQVALFIRMGMSPVQAVAFSGILDDRPIVGVSAIKLASMVMRLVNTEWYAAQRLAAECKEALESLAKQEAEQMRLFS